MRVFKYNDFSLYVEYLCINALTFYRKSVNKHVTYLPQYRFLICFTIYFRMFPKPDTGSLTLKLYKDSIKKLQIQIF